MKLPVAFSISLLLLIVSGEGSAESFVVPCGGNLYLEALGGEAGASGRADFGLGTSPGDFVAYLHDLAPNTSPEGEVLVGFFNAGEIIHFGMQASFAGDTAWGFSNGTDDSSLIAFSDLDNSLGMGGKIIQQTGLDTWVMNLDYANLGYDDDDNDILMQIRLAPVDFLLTGCTTCTSGDIFSANLFLSCTPDFPTELKISFLLPDGSTASLDRQDVVKSSGLKFKGSPTHIELPAGFILNGETVRTTIGPQYIYGSWSLCARLLELNSGETLGQTCQDFTVVP